MPIERDLVGYGAHRPTGTWPGGRRLPVSIVVNYEEGSEMSLLDGDEAQEGLTELGAIPFPNDVRNLAMESMFEYGSRVGVWRLLELFARHDAKVTFFASAVAFERNPDLATTVVERGHEIWPWNTDDIRELEDAMALVGRDDDYRLG